MHEDTFSSVTPEQFAKVSAALAAKGLKISGTSGEIKTFGAHVKFAYDTPTLTITVLSAPHFHNIDAFSTQIHDAVEALL